MSNEDELDEEQRIKEKIKNDKIFNNRYKYGDGMREESEYDRSSTIKVNSNYSDQYLKDIYDYEEELDYNIGVNHIFKMIQKDPELSALLKKADPNNKVRLSKDEINWSFRKIFEIVDQIRTESFYSPIYIMEVIASIIGSGSNDPIKDYKKIFDSLDSDLQEVLIVELNDKYEFLEGNFGKKRMH